MHAVYYLYHQLASLPSGPQPFSPSNLLLVPSTSGPLPHTASQSKAPRQADDPSSTKRISQISHEGRALCGERVPPHACMQSGAGMGLVVVH